MLTFIIVIHLMIVLALCGLVLLQKSEGGGLGMVGGDGEHHRPGGLISNTRLQHALDHPGNRRTVYQVDRFAARGAPSAMMWSDLSTLRPSRRF